MLARQLGVGRSRSDLQRTLGYSIYLFASRPFRGVDPWPHHSVCAHRHFHVLRLAFACEHAVLGGNEDEVMGDGVALSCSVLLCAPVLQCSVRIARCSMLGAQCSVLNAECLLLTHKTSPFTGGTLSATGPALGPTSSALPCPPVAAAAADDGPAHAVQPSRVSKKKALRRCCSSSATPPET